MGGEGEKHYIPSKQTLFVERIKEKKPQNCNKPLAVSSQDPHMTKDKNLWATKM